MKMFQKMWTKTKVFVFKGKFFSPQFISCASLTFGGCTPKRAGSLSDSSLYPQGLRWCLTRSRWRLFVETRMSNDDYTVSNDQPMLSISIKYWKIYSRKCWEFDGLQLQQDLLEPHLSDLKNQLVCFCFANFERAASSSLIMTREWGSEHSV